MFPKEGRPFISERGGVHAADHMRNGSKTFVRENSVSKIMMAASGGEQAQLFGRIDRRILPFLVLCYAFASLDRTNIGFAKLQMAGAIGLGDAAYGFGAGIFFLGYVLFEMPSNFLLTRIGARKTLSRIMVLWGLTSVSMLFVRNEQSFYALRFLLGVFEAGFAPGMIFYLTCWYPRTQMARALAIVLSATPIAAILGGPLSGWVMTSLDSVYGMAGWQWMFLIEGVPSVILGVVAFFYLDDYPAHARWLSDDERRRLDVARGEPSTPRGASLAEVFRVLRNPKIYALALPYFCMISGLYTVAFWLPTLLKIAGEDSTVRIGFYSAIPYLVAIPAMMALARRSDRLAERRLHCTIPLLAGAVALAVGTYAMHSFMIALVSITLATALVYAAYSVFWAIPSDYLKGPDAAIGIALVNSIGLLGGFVSPTIIGWAKAATGDIRGGLAVMVGFLIVGAISLAITRPVAKLGEV